MRKSQKRALVNHRRRMRERGISRYEVRGLSADKELVRSLAKRLSRNDATAVELRHNVRQRIQNDKPLSKGGILAVLRRSPLVGAQLDIEREVDAGREIDL